MPSTLEKAQRGVWMRACVKRGFLHLSKWLGLFHLARRVTRRGLRILCYHGISLGDESAFRPQLFMTPGTFYRRLKFLADKGFRVTRLSEALEGLERGTLPPCATVITFDDGFYSIYARAFEGLRMFAFPATVYVTSYYCLKEKPVFGLLVQYMFWKARWALRPAGDGSGAVPGATSAADLGEDGQEGMEEIVAETKGDEARRSAIAETLGQRLGVDYRAMAQSRALSIVNPGEVRKMVSAGVDIQLHTHRHRFPTEERLATREIVDNRAALEPLVGRPLEHFCYPSGIWSEEQWPWLRAAGILSATTCEPGLNYPGTPRLALRRFLDGEHVSQIEFESEVCGFTELLRQARSWLRHGLGGRGWRRAR